MKYLDKVCARGIQRGYLILVERVYQQLTGIAGVVLRRCKEVCAGIQRGSVDYKRKLYVEKRFDV